jgi:hypothetical protein
MSVRQSASPARKLAAAAAVAANLAGFVAAPHAFAAPDPNSGTLFDLINSEHQAAGCAPYGRSSVLGDVALQYAQTLANNNGKLNPNTVALLQGKGYNPTSWGEMDYYNGNGATPQQTLDFWNANQTKDLITNCDITQMEVAVWINDGKWGSSAIMGTPSGAATPPANNPNPPQPKATGSPDGALLAAVNDARLHPEKYPPHGDVHAGPGAAMTACASPFNDSAALVSAASTHNGNISALTVDQARQNGDWAHRNPPPNGPLSWDGGPLSQAGYNTTGEIVAMGQGSEAAAVQFWMQDDAASQWGHRNLILNCALTDAGASHLGGGAAGNYWTVDMGSH